MNPNETDPPPKRWYSPKENRYYTEAELDAISREFAQPEPDGPEFDDPNPDPRDEQFYRENPVT